MMLGSGWLRDVRAEMFEREWRARNGSDDGDGDIDSGGSAAATTDGGPSAGLYQCQNCESVYVATEKERCRNCDVTVEEVPASIRV